MIIVKDFIKSDAKYCINNEKLRKRYRKYLFAYQSF
jgi:hypothetical protein